MLFNLFKPVRKLSDLELISLYKKKGDVKYVSELFHRYSQLISALSYKYLKHVENAQDAAMDVFELMCKDLLLHDVRKPNNWIYSVTKNHCLKLKRNLSREMTNGESDLRVNRFMESDTSDTLQEKEILEEELIRLENALPKLKEEQRICVQLFYLKKHSYQEIANITGFEIKKVKSFIQNGKRNLKIEIEKTLGEEQ